MADDTPSEDEAAVEAETADARSRGRKSRTPATALDENATQMLARLAGRARRRDHRARRDLRRRGGAGAPRRVAPDGAVLQGRARLRLPLVHQRHRLDAHADDRRRGLRRHVHSRAAEGDHLRRRRLHRPLPGVRDRRVHHGHASARRAEGRRRATTRRVSSRGTRCTRAPTGTSAKRGRCSASSSPTIPRCVTSISRSSSRVTRCARTSRSSPAK